MKLVDVNVLLYAVDETSPQHERARGWLEAVLSGTETVALTWLVLLAFVRLSTRAAVFAAPMTAVRHSTSLTAGSPNQRSCSCT